MKLFRSYLLGLGGVLLSVLCLVPGAQASTFPGANGDIVFSKVKHETTSIWSVSQAGSHDRRLVGRGAHTPVWSPDGRTIAYINGRGQLSVMDRGGGRQRQLTHAPGFAQSSPVWSADGSRIAFVREERVGTGRSAVFMINPVGSQASNVSGWAPVGGYRAASWSPDGTRLVYEQFGQGQTKLLIKNIANHNVQELTTLSESIHSQATWSPNGQKILFNDSSSEVYTIWPDGSHRTVISDGDSQSAAWSPDGRKIVFIEDNGLSISGPDGMVTQVPLHMGVYQEIGPPSWSPDGTKLLFTMSYTTGGRLVSDLFSLRINDVNAQPVKLASGTIKEADWQRRPDVQVSATVSKFN